MNIQEFKEVFLKEVESAFSLIETLSCPVVVFSDDDGDLIDDREIKEFVARYVKTVLTEKMQVRSAFKSTSFINLDRDNLEEQIQEYDYDPDYTDADDDARIKEEMNSIVEFPCNAFCDLEAFW